jgi:Ca2+-binding EF-hand superfamily protein
MKENDVDNDGRLSYSEFKKSLKQLLNIMEEEKENEEAVDE